MKKIATFCLMLLSLCVITPTKADSATKTNTTTRKIILEKTGYFDYQIDISFRTGTNQVIGVASPDGDIIGFTFSSASESGGIVTVNDFIIDFKPAGSSTSSPLDVSGNYY